MPKHEVKCRVCKQPFDTNELVEGKDWIQPKPRYYYHSQCYTDWMTKKDDINAEFDIENDTLWIDLAYEYLRRDLLIPANYVKIQSQWKNLLKKGRTSKGIYFAIRYFYEIEKGDKAKAQGGIGIVDYVYERSSTYWAEKERKGDKILEKIEEQVKALQERETIEIKRTPKKKKNKKIIDLSLIEEME